MRLTIYYLRQLNKGCYSFLLEKKKKSELFIKIYIIAFIRNSEEAPKSLTILVSLPHIFMFSLKKKGNFINHQYLDFNSV